MHPDIIRKESSKVAARYRCCFVGPKSGDGPDQGGWSAVPPKPAPLLIPPRNHLNLFQLQPFSETQVQARPRSDWGLRACRAGLSSATIPHVMWEEGKRKLDLDPSASSSLRKSGSLVSSLLHHCLPPCTLLMSLVPGRLGAQGDRKGPAGAGSSLGHLQGSAGPCCQMPGPPLSPYPHQKAWGCACLAALWLPTALRTAAMSGWQQAGPMSPRPHSLKTLYIPL